MNDTIQPLLRLQTWLSPAFPTGSFAYSHGLETAIDLGKIHDRATTLEWIKGILHQGSGWNDALFFSESWKNGKRGDTQSVIDINDLALALQPSHERWMETTQQGNAFRDAARTWPSPILKPIADIDISLPVVAGALFGAADIGKTEAVATYLNAFVSNLVWICVRLIPLGQSDGLYMLENLESDIMALTQRACEAGLDDLGSCAVISDIASMAHEHISTRICRS